MSAGSVHKRVEVLPSAGLGENIRKKWDLTRLESEIHIEHGYSRDNEETRPRRRSKGETGLC